jgi:hypothetical protein
MGSISVMDAGASPLFPPEHHDIEAAATEVEHLVRRDPRQCGLTQTRWSLNAIRNQLLWLKDTSLSGVASILERLGITWQRARSHVHSPDPNYTAKLALIKEVIGYAHAHPDQIVTVYLDEVTVTRQPTLASDYGRAGADQVRAERSLAADSEVRIVGSLDVVTGQVVVRRANTISLATLVAFYQQLRAAYPQAERIFVVLDNWPVHFHPDVLVALEPQTTPWMFSRPGNWPATPSRAAVRRAGGIRLPIQLVPLPTYASWCNPIEKLWRLMRQEVTHLHRWANSLDDLRTQLDRFFASFATGSPKLLQYVGLG